jgi:cytochrome d ubiquinol oxidase subunit II
MYALQAAWFVVTAFFFTAYAILDGFDLGIAVWYPFAGGLENRNKLLDAIRPFWDGNEVWLLAGGAVVFAAFPPVYAAAFSGLYLALILVILSLIFRAVSIEFLSKKVSPRWEGFWGAAFCIGSLIPSILLGAALGNLIGGMKLEGNGIYKGSFFDLLNPFALITGVLTLITFAVHSAAFLTLKAEGELHTKAGKWLKRSCLAFIFYFIFYSIYLVATQKHLLANFTDEPLFVFLPFACFLSILSIYMTTIKKSRKGPFIFSVLSIIFIAASIAVSMFPKLIISSYPYVQGLDITSTSSSPLTLKAMLIIAVIGMPLVVFYNIWIYKTFKEKDI